MREPTTSFCLINARSLRNKSSEFLDFVVDNKFDVVSVCETWLSTDDDAVIAELSPRGYTFKHIPRIGKRGGGVGFLYRSHLNVKVHTQVNNFTSFEMMQMDVIENSKSMHLVVIYRPPRSSVPFTCFLEEFSNLLDDCLFKQSSLVIAGDFNIHVDTSAPDARELNDVLDSYGLQQHIQQPTHIRGHTLDLLISRKETDIIVLSDVNVIDGISDHSAITCHLHVRSQKSSRQTVVSRNIQSVKASCFMEDLDKASLTNKCMLTNTDIAVNNYNSILEETLTKREYNSERIKDCSGDSKRLFKIASDLLNRKQKSPLPTHTSALDLASRFNKFFTNKVDAIRASLPDVRRPSGARQTATVMDTLTATNEDEVRRILSGSPAKSCKLDPIPTSLLKKCFSAIVPAMTNIINTSLATGVVPADLKRAIVRPTLKKPGMDTESLQSFRPISNLSYLSKVLERVAFSQLSEYLYDNMLLDSHQSAYRPNHSVETLLTNLADDVLQQMDRGNVTALILLDMSSAFDTVDHDILLDQLFSLGVSGTALRWFTSYLTNRHQSVIIGDALSQESSLIYGVPQGSVGGPLLFSLYLQPIGSIIKSHGIGYHCYADDIQLYVSFPPTSTSMSLAVRRLEACIKDIHEWMCASGLKLNQQKTEVIVLGSKQMLGKVDMKDLGIHVGDNVVYPSPQTRNLGVIFDVNMSFNAHVSHISRSIRYQLRNLSFIRSYLTRSATEQLVHALISSRLDFCNSLLLGLSQRQLSKLQRLQNSAARLVTLTKKSCHITPVLQSLHWLQVEKRIIFKVLLLVYHTVHGSSPLYLQNSIHLYQPPRRLRSAGQKPNTWVSTLGKISSILSPNEEFNQQESRYDCLMPCDWF
ncbi:uncharacterized protein [Diadema antillarum]|uniref:uncharacterized protein n=1 Tax=Diadema antillarum TaxID=105358 RepID=UPI003A88EF17